MRVGGAAAALLQPKGRGLSEGARSSTAGGGVAGEGGGRGRGGKG